MPSKHVERERLPILMPLHHCTRPAVARLGEGNNLIRPKFIKGQREAGPADLGCVAISPIPPVQNPADFKRVPASNVRP